MAYLRTFICEAASEIRNLIFLVEPTYQRNAATNKPVTSTLFIVITTTKNKRLTSPAFFNLQLLYDVPTYVML